MLNNKIKTIFIGTPDFAIPSLEAVIKDKNFEVIAVITQPDKKIGRKQIITPPPVKKKAEEFNIPIYQPEKIKNLNLTNLQPDLIVVAAYAQIIPKNILNLPILGCINIHGSLLPKYRGASCIQAAIENGDQETGVTIMLMDEGLDTGSILNKASLPIDKKDTFGSLYTKLANLGGEIIIPTLLKYFNKELKPAPQGNNFSYSPVLKKEDGRINWDMDAKKVERFIRSRQPWPGAFSRLFFSELDSLNFNIKIIEVKTEILKENNYKTGEIFLNKTELAVQCGNNAVVIEKLQIEGKRIITAAEFIRGHKDLVGKILK